MSKRKDTEAYIIKYIDKIAKGGSNKKLYEDLFKSMSNSDFDKFMINLRDGKTTLSVIVPNGGDVKVDINNNFKIAKEIKYEFFQQLKIDTDGDTPPYITPNRYMVYKLPVKRASQLLSKKISIPKDNKSVDLTTGAVTGSSNSSKITMPETQMLIGMGLDDSVTELLKYRGGDAGSQAAMLSTLYKEGRVSSKLLDEASTGVSSTKTLSSYFKAMHIKSTI